MDYPIETYSQGQPESDEEREAYANMHKVFIPKRNNYLATLSDDTLLARMDSSPNIMVNCLTGNGVLSAASALARSIFRVARELERRGYDLTNLIFAHPLDLCACGDFRNQHYYNGECLLNGIHHFGKPDCMTFSLDKIREIK